jgi:CheY-like chemotaxis protein
VVRALRANEATAGLPVVILTAKVLEASEREMLARSVHAVLSKESWEVGAFLQVIRRALRASARQRDGGASQDRLQVEALRREANDGEPPRVLVIDDDPTARDLLRLYLEDAGFAVTAAANTDDALARLGDRRPSLVTLDLAKPEKNGLETLSALAEAEQLKGVPLLVVSGAEGPEKTLAVGAQAVLAKPIRRHEFLETVRRMLGEFEGRPRVLIVDDDPSALKLVTSYFADEPVDVAGARDGREALESIRARRPDLLILDLMMPGMSGFDVLAQLRGDPKTVDLPVVVLTAKELTASDGNNLTRHVQAVFAKGSTGRGALLEQVRRLLVKRGRATPERRGEQ